MFAICTLSAVPMRATPSDKAEMVNQLLHGDTMDILQREERWSLLRCHYDGYEGWVDNKQFQPTSQRMVLPEGPTGANVVDEAMRYLGAPYLWGGRTLMGIDCSGFTQVVFKACGIRLLRDASQQVTQGLPVASVAEAKAGDLCFFHNPEGRITHVGISLGHGRIIHSSGEVRIDRLTDHGIWVESQGQYSHSLHSIRHIG